MERSNIVAYGMGLAIAAAHRSEDPHQKVGAVLLRSDFSVASVGYNGTAAGVDLGDLWMDREARRQYVIHAEVNAFRYATRSDANHGLLFVSGTPCPSCVTVAAAHGVGGIVFGELLENYPILDTSRVAARLDIALIQATPR